MAKSPDLYTLCDICDGIGIAADNTLNETAPNGKKSCLVCRGTRYLPLGLNKAQVDALFRKAQDYDAMKAQRKNLIAQVIELEKLLTRWQRFNEIEEVVNHVDFIALYNDTCKALETVPGGDE